MDRAKPYTELRSLTARQFDRNCVLAATAGQIAACTELGIPIAAIRVGFCTYDVGIVARDIRIDDPSPQTAIVVSFAGSVAFHRAADIPLDGIGIDGDQKIRATVAVVADLIDRWTADGRLRALIKVLDTIATPGDLTDLQWLRVLKGN